jgi:hypothetical protein
MGYGVKSVSDSMMADPVDVCPVTMRRIGGSVGDEIGDMVDSIVVQRDGKYLFLLCGRGEDEDMTFRTSTVVYNRAMRGNPVL